MPSEDDAAQGFVELYRPVAPAIYAWARLHIHAPLRRRVDPEDILQEVCVRALDRFSTYDPEKSPFRSWLFGIARNVLREALRSLRVRGESAFGANRRSDPGGLDRISDEATSISTRIARDERIQSFLTRVSKLDEEEKRLLLYRGLEGRGHQEVAEILAINEETAQKRWQRLRRKIQVGLPEELLVS